MGQRQPMWRRFNGSGNLIERSDKNRDRGNVGLTCGKEPLSPVKLPHGAEG